MSVIPRPREVRPAEPPPSPRSRLVPATWWASGGLGLVVFGLAYENGGSGLTARAVVAIGVWWAVLVGVGFGFLPRARPSRGALIAGAFLAAFAVDTFVSVFWASDAAGAFAEFNRVALYLGLFVLVVLAFRPGELGRWADGLALGLVATGVVALASRLFPGLFSERGLPEFLPNAATRLSFPVGYWNGLAILMGMTVPLCLRAALVSRTLALRGLAAASLPALAAVIYLTSSRGGVATAVVATLVFVAASSRPWHALGALASGAVGTAAALAVLAPRNALVNGPLSSAAAHSQGRVAAVLLLGCCALAGAVHLAGAHLLARREPPSARAGRIVLGVGVAAVVVAVVASHPVRRFEEFKRVPRSVPSGDFVRAHLLSGNGSGRWQFWTAAIDEFRTAPVAGRGAASYEAWWAQHASFTYFLRNAHSLYLEVLGDLGLIGFLLIVGTLVAGLVVALRRLGRAPPAERQTFAALTAVLAAFAAGAAIDWVWQITVVAGVGIVALALVTAAEPVGPRPVEEMAPRRDRGLRFAAGAAALLSGWLLICAQAIPWLASLKLSESQAAVRSGDGSRAFAAAADARHIQPWSASPYLQLALVDEALGRLGAARGWIGKAIDRDPENWRLWLVRARLETKDGQIAAAERSVRRAAKLNPRSPLLSGIVKSP